MLTEVQERPLEQIIHDGGMGSVFHRMGCIGDSLASGELETINEEGKKGFWDCYEYSWAKAMERASGIEMTMFAHGGLMAKTLYREADGQASAKEECVTHLFEEGYLQQGYFMALGVNDIKGPGYAKPIYSAGLGDAKKDVCLEDYEKNADSIVGWYAKIVQRLQSMQPDAKFFFITIPDDCLRQGVEEFNKQIRMLATILKNCYVIDLYKYGPKYDEDFRRKYFDGHMTCIGYQLTAYMMLSYLDWYVRNYPEEFKFVAFIGSGKKPYNAAGRGEKTVIGGFGANSDGD